MSGLQVTPLVKVSQNYRMTADYSFYDFNESSNVLSRTTEVRTGLQSTLGSKAKLDLDHSFRFKDSGRYVRDDPRGAAPVCQGVGRDVSRSSPSRRGTISARSLRCTPRSALRSASSARAAIRPPPR